MRKLRLELEALTVDSFDTTAVEVPKGTVLAQEGTRGCSISCVDSCLQTQCTCAGINTCQQSCNGTCVGYSCQGPTCVGTCATCGANTCEPTCGNCTGWC